MNEQVKIMLQVLPVFIILVITFTGLIVHIVSIIKAKGYSTYLNSLRLLIKFNSIDYKIGYNVDVNYRHINTRISTIKRNHIGCLHYINGSHFLQVQYTDELYDGLYINVSEHRFKESKWHRSDYQCDRLPDFIYFYYYNKLVRKVKKAELIRAKDSKEYSNKINEFIQSESREDNLELLLDE